MADAAQQQQQQPPRGDAHPINSPGWPAAYPAPSTAAFPVLPPATYAAWLHPDSGKQPGRDFLLLDVRRADCEALIPGAINLPAHSFYASLPALLPLLTRVPVLVFHCGNRNTRGTRCAGWLWDALDEQQRAALQIYTLEGGYTGWERTYGVADIGTRGRRPEAGALPAVPL